MGTPLLWVSAPLVFCLSSIGYGVYFANHSQVRLRFKMASGLGEPLCWDGDIPQGCPLSMMFIVCALV